MSEQNQTPSDAVLVTVGGPVDELSVSLGIYGEDLDPSDVTTRLGVEPTKSFRRGYRAGPRSPELPHGAWLLSVRTANHADPGAAVGTLLSKLTADKDVWRQLNSQFSVQLRIAVHMEGWNKGFRIDAGSAAQLAIIGAELIFDIYAYGEEKEKVSESTGG